MVGWVAPSMAQAQKRGPPLQNHDVLIVAEGTSEEPLPPRGREQVIGQGCKVSQHGDAGPMPSPAGLQPGGRWT